MPGTPRAGGRRAIPPGQGRGGLPRCARPLRRVRPGSASRARRRRAMSRPPAGARVEGTEQLELRRGQSGLHRPPAERDAPAAPPAQPRQPGVLGIADQARHRRQPEGPAADVGQLRQDALAKAHEALDRADRGQAGRERGGQLGRGAFAAPAGGHGPQLAERSVEVGRIPARAQEPDLSDMQRRLAQGSARLTGHGCPFHGGGPNVVQETSRGREQRRAGRERRHAGQRLTVQGPAGGSRQDDPLGPELAHEQTPAGTSHPESRDSVDRHGCAESRAQAISGPLQAPGSLRYAQQWQDNGHVVVAARASGPERAAACEQDGCGAHLPRYLGHDLLSPAAARSGPGRPAAARVLPPSRPPAGPGRGPGRGPAAGLPGARRAGPGALPRGAARRMRGQHVHHPGQARVESEESGELHSCGGGQHGDDPAALAGEQVDGNEEAQRVQPEDGGHPRDVSLGGPVTLAEERDDDPGGLGVRTESRSLR